MGEGKKDNIIDHQKGFGKMELKTEMKRRGEEIKTTIVNEGKVISITSQQANTAQERWAGMRPEELLEAAQKSNRLDWLAHPIDYLALAEALIAASDPDK